MKSSNKVPSNTIVIFLCIVLMLFASAGIAGGLFRWQSDIGTKISPEQKADIVKGKTTRVQILQELGDPDQKIDLGKGQLQYSYLQGTKKSSLATQFKYSFGGKPSDMVKFTEFWVVFKNDVVHDFGEKPTNKRPKF